MKINCSIVTVTLGKGGKGSMCGVWSFANGEQLVLMVSSSLLYIGVTVTGDGYLAFSEQEGQNLGYTFGYTWVTVTLYRRIRKEIRWICSQR